MIHFERSTDYELIRRIMTHPKVWPKISDDSSPAPEDFYPIESDMVWYVTVRDVHPDGIPAELLGLWMFVPHNGVCWEVHTCLLPEAWGERAHRAARMLAGWVWENTPCRRVITNVPADNRVAFHFALDAGMEVYGTNEASFLKKGRLLDQICLGITRPRDMPLVESFHSPSKSEEWMKCLGAQDAIKEEVLHLSGTRSETDGL